MRSSEPRKRCVCLAGLPQRTQMASVLVIDSACASNSGIGAKRTAEVIGIKPGDDYLLAAIGEALRDINQTFAHEIGLVDADHFGAPIDAVDNFGGVGDYLRIHAQIAVGDDLIGGIPVVDGGLENLHPLARDHGAAQPADQLLALAGEHGAADDFDPTDIAGDDIHSHDLNW